MPKFLKAAHLVGFALFFGSILGHAVAGLAESAHFGVQSQLVIRQVSDVTTWVLTVPDLALVILTGAGMVFLRKPQLLKMRWVKVHLAIGALILLNAVFILVPAGQEILKATAELAAGNAKLGDLIAPEGREAVFGAINIVLCIAAVLVAVFRPRLGKTGR